MFTGKELVLYLLKYPYTKKYSSVLKKIRFYKRSNFFTVDELYVFLFNYSCLPKYQENKVELVSIFTYMLSHLKMEKNEEIFLPEYAMAHILSAAEGEECFNVFLPTLKKKISIKNYKVLQRAVFYSVFTSSFNEILKLLPYDFYRMIGYRSKNSLASKINELFKNRDGFILYSTSIHSHFKYKTILHRTFLYLLVKRNLTQSHRKAFENFIIYLFKSVKLGYGPSTTETFYFHGYFQKVISIIKNKLGDDEFKNFCSEPLFKRISMKVNVPSQIEFKVNNFYHWEFYQLQNHFNLTYFKTSTNIINHLKELNMIHIFINSNYVLNNNQSDRNYLYFYKIIPSHKIKFLEYILYSILSDSSKDVIQHYLPLLKENVISLVKDYVSFKKQQPLVMEHMDISIRYGSLFMYLLKNKYITLSATSLNKLLVEYKRIFKTVNSSRLLFGKSGLSLQPVDIHYKEIIELLNNHKLEAQLNYAMKKKKNELPFSGLKNNHKLVKF